MSWKFPNYDREPLGDGRTFSATFSSWDQYKDLIYYQVTLHEDGRDLPPFTIVVVTYIPGREWDQPNFATRLLDDFLPIVKAGKTNVPDATFRF
ncbi:MAG TPA: hypothetical protein VHB97_25870 [Polyangia bacterium]|nr:hypothetical protein [Polyangia bacterium]